MFKYFRYDFWDIDFLKFKDFIFLVEVLNNILKFLDIDFLKVRRFYSLNIDCKYF